MLAFHFCSQRVVHRQHVLLSLLLEMRVLTGRSSARSQSSHSSLFHTTTSLKFEHALLKLHHTLPVTINSSLPTLQRSPHHWQPRPAVRLLTPLHLLWSPLTPVSALNATQGPPQDAQGLLHDRPHLTRVHHYGPVRQGSVGLKPHTIHRAIAQHFLLVWSIQKLALLF